jgi:choline kinase
MEIITNGVIIAAGTGSRFGPLTSSCPKVLLPINGMLLISYPIQALVAAGITDITIIVGYLAKRIIKTLGDGSRFGVRLHYIFNKDYHAGNAISVYKAKEFINEEPFILCMGDHVIKRDLIKRLLNRKIICNTLCIDLDISKHLNTEEATKVTLDRYGYIEELGKHVKHWDAVDTGVFLLTQDFFKALNEMMPTYGKTIEISDVVCHLVKHGYHFRTCDVTGCFWADVDTAEMLEAVEVQVWKMYTMATFPNT